MNSKDGIIERENVEKKFALISDESEARTPEIWTSPGELREIEAIIRSSCKEDLISKDLRRVFHFTSLDNWLKVLNEGYINPQSVPYLYSTPEEHPQDVRAIRTSNHYVVGIPSVSFDKWVEYRYLQNLVDHTRGSDGTRGMLLAFTISDTSGVFLQEAIYNSPKYLQTNLSDHDYTAAVFVPSLRQSPQLWDGYLKTIASTTLFSEYDGRFKVPEIWTPHKIPISDLKIVPLDH